MGVVVLSSVMRLEAAGDRRSVENKANRDTATAEFYIARQENALRGYLLSQDPYYIERVDAHRAKFLAAMQELRAELPAERAGPVDKAIQANATWYANVVQPSVVLIREGRAAEAVRMVGRSGAADPGSLRLANRLLGNPEGTAALEVTFGGLEVRALGGMWVAVTGATTPATVDGRPVGHAAVTWLPDGASLRLGAATAGLRSYVAVRGGIDVDPVLRGAAEQSTRVALRYLKAAP
mgnify:CR=1 FL=1